MGETFRNPTTGVYRLIESIARVEPPTSEADSVPAPAVKADSQSAFVPEHGPRGESRRRG
jgi:hypothetical protein